MADAALRLIRNDRISGATKTPSSANDPAAGQNPPCDLEAEAAVLSAVMLEQNALDAVLGVLPAEPGKFKGDPHFHSDENRLVYLAICELHKAGEPLDTITVAGWLRARQLMPRVKASHLGELIDATPSVGNVLTHAYQVRECALQRAAIRLFRRGLAEGYGDVGDRQAWRLRMLADLELLVERGARLDSSSAAEAITSAMQRMADAENETPLGLVRTGFQPWDSAAGGLYLGDVTGLLAPSGKGKTALAMCIARSCAQLNAGAVDVHIIGIEQDKEALSMRMVQQIGHIDLTAMRMGKAFDPGIWGEIASASTAFSRLPIDITCRPRMTSRDIISTMGVAAAKARNAGRSLVVVVDNLHDIDQSPQQEARPRAEESGWLRMMTWDIKRATNRYNCATLLVAQGNAKGDVFNSPRSKQPLTTLCSLVVPDDRRESEKLRHLVFHKQRNLPEATSSAYYHGECFLFSADDRLGYPW